MTREIHVRKQCPTLRSTGRRIDAILRPVVFSADENPVPTSAAHGVRGSGARPEQHDGARGTDPGITPPEARLLAGDLVDWQLVTTSRLANCLGARLSGWPLDMPPSYARGLAGASGGPPILRAAATQLETAASTRRLRRRPALDA
jgi:hypothetical protein